MAHRVARLAFLLLCATAFGDRGWKASLPHRATRRGHDTSERQAAIASFGRGPLNFEENKGQVDPAVRFFARGSEHQLFLTAAGATLVRSRGGDKAAAIDGVLRMTLTGADP